MLTGENGIIVKARDAKEENIEREEKEKIEIAYNALIIKKNTGKISEITADNLKHQMIDDGENESEFEIIGSSNTGGLNIGFFNSKNEFVLSNTGKIENVKKTLKMYLIKYCDREDNQWYYMWLVTSKTGNFSDIKVELDIDENKKTHTFKNMGQAANVNGYRITAECLNSVYIGGLRGKMNEFSFENKMKQKVIGLSLITGEEIEGDIITITDKNNVMELEDFVNQINTNTIK